jgi:hypothetical protein
MDIATLEIDLLKQLNVDLSYPGIEIGYELWAVETIAETTNRHLPQVRDQYRRHAEHLACIDKSLDYEEKMHAMQEVEEVADRILPRFIHGPELMAAWALLESAIEGIADYIRDRERLEVAFGDIRARNFQSRFNKYFHGVVGMDVPITESDWEELSRLQKFRHVLAHRNGRIDTGSQESMEKLIALAERTHGISITRHRLFFEYKYVSNAIAVVRRAIAALDGAVAARYDWAPIITVNADDGAERVPQPAGTTHL